MLKLACLFTLAAALLAVPSQAVPAPQGTTTGGSPCKRTKVAILGAGVAGITAAQALSNASISDFLIVEYQDRIGGRVHETAFGTRPDGNGKYNIELGANWVQGLNNSEEENPIWTLTKQYELVNTYSNFDNVAVFNENGTVDDGYKALLGGFLDSYGKFERDAGEILSENLQDRSVRSGLSLAGWRPGHNPVAQALEWYSLDYQYASPPEVNSQQFTVVNYNTSYYRWSQDNNFVHDPRGFSAFVKGEASTFLAGTDDPRLLLNTVVRNITYAENGVVIHNDDDTCISANFAICTFSLGVLQHEAVTFSPALPEWKQTAIHSMSMGTYTKIFMQFPKDGIFWDQSKEFFLYADSARRGYYPVFQSLDHPDFEPDSGILFVTVVHDQAYAVEAQDDETTKAQVMNVLRRMYGQNISDPIDFYYPRWSLEPWSYGAYSNWGPSLSLEMHQNLRANLHNLFFAGEAYHPQYFGLLQGAWYEGKGVGEAIAGCINDGNCKGETRYPTLKGVTPTSGYSMVNGWTADSFAKNDADSAFGHGG